MIQTLHSVRVESGDGKILDLEILLNQVLGILKPEDEGPDDDTTLQALLSAQVRKTNYENSGAAMQDRPVPKRNSDPRNQQPEPRERDKLYQLVLDMKAQMGTMRKALVQAEISLENVPNGQKMKHASDKGKQKNNFVGTAKKRSRKDKVAQRSLVAVEEKDSVSDSDEDPQPEYVGVAIVVKSQNRLSPRTINSHPRLAGMKRHDLDRINLKRVKAREASSDCRESLDEVEAYLATDGIETNDLFGSPMLQQPVESRDATDTQGDAPETLHTMDLYPDLESEVGVSDEDGGERVEPESDEETQSESDEE
jgi:hypothetical protein